MSAQKTDKTNFSQLSFSRSPSPEMDGRPELEDIPYPPVHRNMSPRSTLYIGREKDGNKSQQNHKHKSIPKAPIKKVSFLTTERIPNNTEHTVETMLTIKEELALYCDCDQEDEAEHDYDDGDEEAEHDYDDVDEDHAVDATGDQIDDLITTTSPTGIVQATPDATITTYAKNASRRKIRWSGQVRVQEIHHINNMSQAEREAVWMSPIDYKMIKNMAKTTVLMMMAGEYIDDDDPDLCTRGLEFRTRKGNKIRSANKLRAKSAVLNEQDLQRDEGFHDPEFIAMASLDVSHECREQAQKRGVKDAQAILTFVNDVQREVRMKLF
mmetsp:Transcript_23119/g.54661  ORF Transcript_23119/g.54661 Transcript_23119/m.54661 type:complete len:325 (+) Transcript_23119:323-1297(+)